MKEKKVKYNTEGVGETAMYSYRIIENCTVYNLRINMNFVGKNDIALIIVYCTNN